jgi:IrrE N-terminal-like domain
MAKAMDDYREPLDKLDIELSAWELHRDMWKDRLALCPGREVSPIEMLEPELAAKVLGVKFEYFPELGRFGDSQERYEIAGFMDRRRNKIGISMKFRGDIPRFTAAHELGHWTRHPREGALRDRPVKGMADLTVRKPLIEREADYFAACFLMPRRLVKGALESTFQAKEPIIIDDGAAFWLRPDDPESLIGAEPNSLDRFLAIAGARKFGTRQFDSLASQFRVSVISMAIRLKELGLVQAYP